MWTISPVTPYSYAIFSTANPFAPTFSDVPLTLQDANQYAERFTFNLTLAHASIVDGALAPDDPSTTTCWFNGTVMAVTLWTRMPADFPAGVAAANVSVGGTGADGAFAAWPYRVEVTQTQQGGGAGVPDCIDAGGKAVGGADLGADGECGCTYRNFELGGAAVGGNGTAAAGVAANATVSAARRV